MMLNEQATQAERDELRERLGLNAAVRHAVSGASSSTRPRAISASPIATSRRCSTLIAERFPATLELVWSRPSCRCWSAFRSACSPRSIAAAGIRKALQFVSIVGVSLPSFVVGILLILVFSVTLGWLPAFGRGDVVQIGWWSTGLLTPSGRAALILPSIALSLYQITLVMRLVRAEMLEVLRTDFIKFARARGLPRWRINFRHALRNCLMPVVTMTAMKIGILIAFALITETVFQWPGMGLLFIQAVTFVDIPVMAAYLCIVSFIFVALNTLVDIAYAVIDPRLRDAHDAEAAPMTDHGSEARPSTAKPGRLAALASTAISGGPSPAARSRDRRRAAPAHADRRGVLRAADRAAEPVSTWRSSISGRPSCRRSGRLTANGPSARHRHAGPRHAVGHPLRLAHLDHDRRLHPSPCRCWSA